MIIPDRIPDKERNFIIYKITNLINGKIYIGQTTHTIKRRKREHINNARGGSAMALYRAMRKYGVDNFVFKPICYCLSREEASRKEIEMIKFLNSKARHIGYNMTDGGEGTSGCKPSAETLKKMYARKLSEKTRARIGKALTGKKQSDETKAKRGKTLKGRKPWITGHHHSEETKERLSEIMKRRILSQESRENISAAVKKANAARIVSAETKQKISIANKGHKPWNVGKHISDETKAKISAFNKGKTMSIQSRAKMSLAKLGNKHCLGRCDSDETRAKKSKALKRHWRAVKIS